MRDRLGEIEEVYKYLMMNSIEDEGGVPRKQVDRMLQKCSKVKAMLKGAIMEHTKQAENVNGKTTTDISRVMTLLE